MAEQKNTPKDWKCAEVWRNDPGLPIYHKPKVGKRVVICWMNCELMEWDANAALIAKAPLIPELVETLRELADLQNGAPLVKYEAEWKAVMEKTYALLAKAESK